MCSAAFTRSATRQPTSRFCGSLRPARPVRLGWPQPAGGRCRPRLGPGLRGPGPARAGPARLHPGPGSAPAHRPPAGRCHAHRAGRAGLSQAHGLCPLPRAAADRGRGGSGGSVSRESCSGMDNSRNSPARLRPESPSRCSGPAPHRGSTDAWIRRRPGPPTCGQTGRRVQT